MLSEFLFVPNSVPKVGTVELHFSELVGTVSHPDKNKIRIIDFFLNRVPLAVLSSPVTIYSTYPRLNLAITPNLKF